MRIEAFRINLALACLLVALGLWSYEASGRDSHTLSIPVMGIILSFFHKPLRLNEAAFLKWVAIITGVYLIVLIMPLRNSFNGGNMAAFLRVSLMFAATLLATIGYLYRIKQIGKNSA